MIHVTKFVRGGDVNGFAWNEVSLYNTSNLTSGEATASPLMRNNGTNTSTIRKSNVVGHHANFSSANTLTFTVLQHNMTSDGAFTNITIPASGTNFNATANVTILFGNTTNYVIKWYANTSGEQNNTIPSASYTTSNTAPFGIPRINIPPNQSFINTSSVTFNATNVSDVDNNTITIYWYLNDVFNTSANTPVGDNTRGNVTITGLNNGNYTIRVAAYDGTTFSTNSTTINFTVDTIAPSMTIIANTPSNSSFLNVSSIFINTSQNDAGNDHNEFSAFIDFNRSLVGYWRFEDDADTNASDFNLALPTVTRTNHQILTPGIATLVITAYAPTVSVPAYSLVGAIRLYAAAGFVGYSFFFEATIRSTAGTVYARLRDLTIDAVVANSPVSSSSATMSRLRSAAISLVDQREYRVEVGRDPADAGQIASAAVICVPA